MNANNYEQNDMIIGASLIEEETGQDYVLLQFKWKPEFGFPVEKIGGQPCVNRKALAKWIQEWGGTPIERLTTRMLVDADNQKRIDNMQGQVIRGLNNICRFLRYPPDVVMRWTREDNSPFQKQTKEWCDLTVNTKDLLLWMRSMNLLKGVYVIDQPIRINREEGPPEFY